MISKEQEDWLRRVMRVVTMYVIQIVKGGVKKFPTSKMQKKL